MIDAEFIKKWASKYPLSYDTQHYDPYIQPARNGDKDSLRKVTEWKNVGKGPRPMKLWKTQEKAFQYFLQHLDNYRREGGSKELRNNFKYRAPVWSMFWHHVLCGTPIFDVYTHMAFIYFTSGRMITKKEAKITAPGHWQLYGQYVEWFNRTIESVQTEDHTITERELDRALFSWGEEQNKNCRTRRCTGRRGHGRLGRR